MQNQDQKSSKSRKGVVAIIIGLLLIVFPAVSWFYLHEGINWRKEALSELRDYGKIPTVNIIFPGNEKENRVAGKVCVVHMFGDDPDLDAANRYILDTGQKLFDQFSQNESFRMVMIANGGTAEFKTHAQTLPSADYATWVWTSGVGKWTTVLLNGYEYYVKDEQVKPVDNYYALTDTSGIIRRFYNAEDEKDVSRMVQQIAILLPSKQ
ncbi:MAG: hypothetical protein IPL65_18775 [Lewinellaceae bacterium]|nr:hypothetical protein [Lewinellaceae bacterium]